MASAGQERKAPVVNGGFQQVLSCLHSHFLTDIMSLATAIQKVQDTLHSFSHKPDTVTLLVKEGVPGREFQDRF